MRATARQTSSTEVPRTLVLKEPVAQRLSSRNIDQTVDMVASRLRFLLGAEYKAQIADRTNARIAARDEARRLLLTMFKFVRCRSRRGRETRCGRCRTRPVRKPSSCAWGQANSFGAAVRRTHPACPPWTARGREARCAAMRSGGFEVRCSQVGRAVRVAPPSFPLPGSKVAARQGDSV
jgi:hypothetical protein